MTAVAFVWGVSFLIMMAMSATDHLRITERFLWTETFGWVVWRVEHGRHLFRRATLMWLAPFETVGISCPTERREWT